MEDTKVTSSKLDEQQYVILSGSEARPQDGRPVDELDLSAVPRALPEDGIARLNERKAKASRLSAGSDATIDSIESDQDITLSSQSHPQNGHLQESNGLQTATSGASEKKALVQPEISTVEGQDDNGSGPEILTARNGVVPILRGLEVVKNELKDPVNGKHLNGADTALALEQQQRTQAPKATTHDSQEKWLANGEHKPKVPAPEPIAICGMAMRYPGGVRTAEAFWEVVSEGKDLRGPIPADRFNIDGFDGKLGKKGQVDTRHGYFLDEDLGYLDTSFFSMSKLEVEKTDPQQRLLLEVARECFENAGEADYRGRLVGCYVGTFGEDWLHMQSREPQFTGGYNFSGDLMIANRLSYEYDLKGPSMVIKTGCSASLVGLHEACMSLQTGGCTSAIVAGTSLLMGPTIYSTMTSEGVLSPEGSCKTFDAEANGFARAEGINAVYLKRLDDAIRDGNPIRAVIRNSGTNSDGKSQGLLNPSSAAQEALMRKLYQDAGLNPTDTPFIECHGTGTPTGDPIETHAVGNLFKDRGIYIGSSKPNFGHSEGASGLTGLIKAVLALENKTIPPNIKFGKPNPKIKFDEFNLAVPLKPVPWPSNRAERVSINSFGIGGTNAHCIVDSAKSHLPSYETNGFHSKAGPAAQLLVCSANSQDAVKKVVEDTVAYLQAHPERADALAYTLARRREALPHRSFVVVANGKASEPAPSVKAPQQAPPLALVFTGQGAQWPQMGRQLLESDPNFRDDVRAMDQILSQAKIPPTWTLEDELLRPKETSNVYRAELSQPLCTAVQVALVNALRRVGIVPDAVVGHSSGEIAAAYAAGAMSLREAILASYYRGLTTKYQELKGGMAAVGLSAAETAEFLVDGVVVAAENSPSATTISGDLDKLEDVIAAVKAAKPDVLARKLQVDMAYHSHHMSSLARHYLNLLQVEMDAGEENHRPKIPMFSSVTSKVYNRPLTAQYWVDNLVSPVKFLPAVNALLKELPQTLFLEVGPHSQMAGPLRQICAEARAPCNYISTMIRGADCSESFTSAIGQLWQQGAGVDFASLFPRGKVLTDLPLYPWDHSTRYWYESRIAKEWRFREFGHHALLGQRIPELSELEPAWRCVLDLEDVPWLADHKVRDDIIFPFAGYVSMAGEAIRQITGIETGYSVRHVIVPTALVLNVSKPVELLTSLRKRKLTDSSESEYWDFTISSYSGSAWMRHCEGTVKPAAERLADAKEISSLPRKISASRWYKMLGHVGLNYGPEFQGVTSLQTSVTSSRAVGEIAGKVERPFLFHPTTMDTCFQLVIAAAAQGLGRNLKHLVVPTLIEEIDVFPGTESMFAEAWGSAGEADVGIECIADGQVALRLRGVRLNPLEDDKDASGEDIHAAARLEWYPDVDFMDVGPLFNPPTIDNSVKLTLEEMVLLCTLDSADRVEGLTAGQPHFNNFREWLHRERGRAGDGTYPPIIKDTFPYTKLTKEERKAAILERADKICADPSFGDVARGILRIWENTEDLFTGQKDTLEILMEDGVLTGIYNCISFGFSKFVKMLAISKPNLRILEVGAGTGGTTEMILRDLVSTSQNPMYSTYTFTDISAGFFPQATERFSYAPNMEYKVFDISSCPFDQGYTPESYDLILAPNVVHATPSLYTTLSNLQPLLKPGGQLVLTEVCAVARGPGYIFGNFSGWWMGEADGRKWEPYIFLDRWETELKGAGFTGVDTAVVDAEEPYQYCAAIVSTTTAKQNKPELPAVTVLCDSPEQQQTQTLISHLQSQNIDVSVVRFGDGPIPAGQPVLATVDLETPFFENISKQRFEHFQSLCREHQDQKLLWLMPPTQINCPNPRHAQSLGALRGAQAELGVPFHTLEISPAEPEFADLVLKVLRKVHRTDDDEGILRPDREYAVDNGVIKIPRFGAFHLEEEVGRKSVSGTGAAEKELAIGKPGLLETLHWVDVPGKILGEDEVEIETRAVGLNFRDVMVAMGVLSFDGKHPLGIEVSGIVSRVGANVNNVAVGDRVVGVALDGAFSTKAVVDSALCAVLPESFSFEEAATIPCVYMTALYALYTVGQLTPETTVLIHSACGGIGHAAVALCKAVGAEIFVTVGSDVKAQYAMDTYGLPRNRIFHSRDDSFVADVLRETDGQGVDIVLNSLSGKLLHASWKCVAEFGKMIELGKRDLVGFGKLDMEPFLMNRSYCCVDLAHMIQKKPKQAGKILDQVMDMCRDGRIKPMETITLFEAQEIEHTFRHLQKGDHIGKAVVKVPSDASLIPSTNTATAMKLDSDATYLLTGGLGGLGRAIAVWMAEHGARNFVFISRSAGTTTSDQEFFEELRSMGCTAAAVAGKAEDIEAVKSALALAPSPIKGVIHMAMVLRDQKFVDMPHEDWCAAIAPKVNGAWNLHNALEGQKLDFFISTSSGVTTFADHIGQSNYSAANCFLEAFTIFRRRQGLPATVLNICPVDDVGFIADNNVARKKLRSQGLYFLTEKEFMEYMELLLLNQLPEESDYSNNLAPWRGDGNIVMGLRSEVHLDDAKCQTEWRRDRRMGTYHNVRDSSAVAEGGSGSSGALKAFLAGASNNPDVLDGEDSVAYLAQEIGLKIFAFMMKDEAEVDVSMSLAQIGMDSLMAIELRRWWKQTFALEISTLEIMGSGTLRQLGGVAAEGLKKKIAGEV